jgi:hypothetical protein
LPANIFNAGSATEKSATVGSDPASIRFSPAGVSNFGRRPLPPSVFLENKTVILATSGGSTYDDCFVIAKRNDDANVYFYNYGNGGGLQDVFTKMNLEIRVYQ